jgi:cytochrome c oxidase assembly protein subunit 15
MAGAKPRSMTTAAFHTAPQAGSRSHAMDQVRLWLAIMATLVFIMVLVGGATRLTDSGLSITEWRPFMGAIPPFSDAAWIIEFEKYRQIPQYQLMNKGMHLAEFKFIYWWEWGHRQFGRFIGFAWFVPLLWFAAKGVVRGKLFWQLAFIGALGGLQGAVGWIMVHSGLQEGMVSVAPIKLTLHLTLACIIFTSIIWMWSMLGGRGAAVQARVGLGARLMLGGLFAQIALGGLVAGVDAGLSFNTWPLMDGGLAPSFSTLFVQTPWLQNFAANVALVQFNHRTGAYLLLGLALWHLLSTRRSVPGTNAAFRAHLLAGLILCQAALGVVTLLLQVPLWAGLAHQGFAVILLGVAARHAEQARGQAASA